MTQPIKLDPQRAMLLVIDVQSRLLPSIIDHEFVVAATATLMEGTAVFDVPLVTTVQYVKGLGMMDERLAAIARRRGVEPVEKATFSVCRDDGCRSRLAAFANRPQVIVAGIEGHVCVLQTVLDLLEMERQPIVCADAVGSRHDLDLDLAFTRMQEAGAVLSTTEAILFELCEVSGTAQFKIMLELVKSLDKLREE